MKDIKLINLFYKPGYSDMRGGYHSAELKKTEGNKWVVECSDREDHRSPNVVTVYAVADEAVADLEKFLARKKFKSLEKRLKSDTMRQLWFSAFAGTRGLLEMPKPENDRLRPKIPVR